MRTNFRRVGYSLKVMLSGSLLGVFLLALILATFVAQPHWLGFEQRGLHEMLTLMLLVMPVMAVVIFANSGAEELEEKLLRLLYAYPYKMLYVILEKITICLICLLVIFALNIGVAHLGFITLSWEDVIYLGWRALPATLFLGALSLLVSLLGRNMLAGLGAGVGYWFLELITQGKWTNHLYLFQAIWPINKTTQNENSLWLLLIGCIMLLTAVLLFHKSKAWLS